MFGTVPVLDKARKLLPLQKSGSNGTSFRELQRKERSILLELPQRHSRLGYEACFVLLVERFEQHRRVFL